MAGRDAEYLALLRRRAARAAAVAATAPRTADGAAEAAVVRFWREADRDAMAEVPRVAMPVAALTVRGAAGPLAARRYRPSGAGRTLLVFVHGGGWCFGDLESYDPVARTLAAATGAPVLAPAYRLAPEDPFPAGLDDVTAVLRAACADPGAWDADRVAVAGDSAGANLATVAARRLRDAGEPGPVCQVLVYPAVDARAVPPLPPDPDGLAASDGLANLDGRTNLDGPTGPADPTAEEDDGPAANVRRYLAGAADPADPDVSPLLTPDLRGMPPTVLVTAEYDRYRAQGEAYAAVLRAAGVPVSAWTATGLDHGFLGLAPLAAAPAAAARALAAAVRPLL